MLARISVGTAAIMAGVLCLAAFVTSDDDPTVIVPEATGESGPEGLTDFYQQDLRWTSCGAAICSWVRVPVDYTEPEGKTIRLRVKLRPADPDRRKGRLFINPGGPGGSGVDYVGPFAATESPAVLAAYDIVGFDPRGVGRSAPLRCVSDARLGRLLEVDPSPDTAREVTRLKSARASLGDACRDEGGELASHVSTYEVAQDLDILRAVMGERRLTFYGASYGTQLGATYAELFPATVGPMVLDGGVDPGRSRERQGYGQAVGFDRALTAYLEACVAGPSCPLGDDVETARTGLADLLDRLDARPMAAEGSRRLTEASAFYGLAFALYDTQTWPALTRAVNRASFGDGRDLLGLADRYFGRRANGTFRDNAAQVQTAVRCLDFPDKTSDERLTKLLPRYQKASPVFGRILAWTAQECDDWPMTARHPQAKVTGGATAPILVIGTTRDPATPYSWSKALARQVSGVLVTRDGDGHTGYRNGSRCVDRIVQRFLLRQEAPDADVRCEGPA